MNTERTPSSVDARLQQVFDAPLGELYATALHPESSPALGRALELRSFLALAEEQVARVRDRVHETMAPDRDMGELSAEDLRMDALWLDTALDARDGYRAAIDDLLRTMPAPLQPSRPVRTAQSALTTTLPPAVVPAPPGAGTAPTRRP
ncbi:hypothetical protein [Streptomyces sp. NPDC047042]|uniref:hypothetical protein n=1 Tax=Streptomyces sp. NPDC047042 TaxID=3154807 RepID=UPI0033E3F581